MSLVDRVPGGESETPRQTSLAGVVSPIGRVAQTTLGRAIPVGVGLAAIGKRDGLVRNSLLGASIIDAIADSWKILRGERS